MNRENITKALFSGRDIYTKRDGWTHQYWVNGNHENYEIFVHSTKAGGWQTCGQDWANEQNVYDLAIELEAQECWI